MEAGKRPEAAAATAELMRAAEEFGIQLSTEQIATFETYLETLLLWAGRLSLTAARNARQITTDHIQDSFSVVPWIKPGASVADLGSGAGFPGIPIAIARRDVCALLLEARRKRANFLREVMRRCMLRNTVVVEERAEAFAAKHPACVDVTVSRAVWALRDFLALSRVLLRSGGLAIAMKGPQVKSVAAPEDGFFDPRLVSYMLPGGAEHVLVMYRRR